MPGTSRIYRRPRHWSDWRAAFSAGERRHRVFGISKPASRSTYFTIAVRSSFAAPLCIWFDIFQTSVIAAFQDIQARTGTQKLWVGPNEHYFVYATNFWPRDPYFDWFGHWLKDEPSALVDEPAVYYSTRAWVDDRAAYEPTDWRRAERWPPPGVAPRRLYLRGDGSLGEAPSGEELRYRYDPRRPIPTLGGRNMLIDAGPRDQRPAQVLPDYGLIYRRAARLGHDDRRKCSSDPQYRLRLPRHRFRREARRAVAGRPGDAANGRNRAGDVPRSHSRRATAAVRAGLCACRRPRQHQPHFWRR
jgi:hypothetical protein